MIRKLFSRLYHSLLFYYHHYYSHRLYRQNGYQTGKFMYHRWRKHYHKIMIDDMQGKPLSFPDYVSDSYFQPEEKEDFHVTKIKSNQKNSH